MISNWQICVIFNTRANACEKTLKFQVPDTFDQCCYLLCPEAAPSFFLFSSLPFLSPSFTPFLFFPFLFTPFPLSLPPFLSFLSLPYVLLLPLPHAAACRPLIEIDLCIVFETLYLWFPPLPLHSELLLLGEVIEIGHCKPMFTTLCTN